MNKMLIAIDGSGCSMKAVHYAGDHFFGLSDLRITLLHVFPEPALYWDEGHILSDAEREDRKRFADQWKDRQRQIIKPILKDAISFLIQKGIRQEQISVKESSDTIEIADSIIEEIGTGAYETLLVGHCTHPEADHFIRGSIIREIVHRLTGATIIIVDA